MKYESKVNYFNKLIKESQIDLKLNADKAYISFFEDILWESDVKEPKTSNSSIQNGSNRPNGPRPPRHALNGISPYTKAIKKATTPRPSERQSENCLPQTTCREGKTNPLNYLAPAHYWLKLVREWHRKLVLLGVYFIL